MSDRLPAFEPVPPLVPGFAHSRCRACVTVPARNEARSLVRCLAALAAQVHLDGSPLRSETFEVLLLLNNCEDDSVEVARRWKRENPDVVLHVSESTLSPEKAHVGTARRLLMDTAWTRLGGAPGRPGAILSTDADSLVAPDWVAQNLRAMQGGADVIGGLIHVLPEDLQELPEKVRRCYEQDRLYAQCIARLEDLLDPCAGDPWPRHLDHFGSSLACTREAYAAVGGMPAVSPLEDEAFVDRVRRANLILRHEPRVSVSTSARLQGRAEVGLAGQFRLWSELPNAEAHRVQSAAFLEHRFRLMRKLRQIFFTKDLSRLQLPTPWWKNTFREALDAERSCAGFLGAVYCNTLIAESFHGQVEESIAQAIAGLQRRIAEMEKVYGKRKRQMSDGAFPGSTAVQVLRALPELVQ